MRKVVNSRWPWVKVSPLLASPPPDMPEVVGVREGLLSGARQLVLTLECPDNLVDPVCFGVSILDAEGDCQLRSLKTRDTVSIKVATDLGINKLIKEKSRQSTGAIVKAMKSSSSSICRPCCSPRCELLTPGT